MKADIHPNYHEITVTEVSSCMACTLLSGFSETRLTCL